MGSIQCLEKDDKLLCQTVVSERPMLALDYKLILLKGWLAVTGRCNESFSLKGKR